MRDRPIRALHVIASLNVGGIETWFKQLVTHRDPKRLQIDVAVDNDASGDAYYQAVCDAGARVFACPSPSRPWQYARQLRRVIRNQGPFDVVHAHTYHGSALPLWLAKRAGVPIRIAHARNVIDTSWTAQGLKSIYHIAARRLLNHSVTHALAVSASAGAAVFGPDAWERLPHAFLPSAIDLEPFRHECHTSRRVDLRRQLGVSDETPLLGFVGRLADQKYPGRAIDILAELHRSDPAARHTRLVIVGDGPLRPALSQQAKAMGLANHVHFLGARNDIPRLMCHLFDVLLFPSRYEGLGRVAVEAQAAGLPVVMSDRVPPEATVTEALCQSLSLDAPMNEWARGVKQALTRGRLDQHAALEHVASTRYDMDYSVNWLTEFYERGLGRPARPASDLA